jgi:hypothetical protein
MFVDELGTTRELFPNLKSERDNLLICLSGASFRPFHAICINIIPDLHFTGDTQGFPLFTYSKDGKHKQENVTPKARTLFQIFYDDDSITAADIFHYVYAVLHHPAYRTRFAENLKRDLPRIPFIGVAADVRRLNLNSPPETKTGNENQNLVTSADTKLRKQVPQLRLPATSPLLKKQKRSLTFIANGQKTHSSSFSHRKNYEDTQSLCSRDNDTSHCPQQSPRPGHGLHLSRPAH